MILVPLGIFLFDLVMGICIFCLVWVFGIYCVMVVKKVSYICTYQWLCIHGDLISFEEGIVHSKP